MDLPPDIEATIIQGIFRRGQQSFATKLQRNEFAPMSRQEAARRIRAGERQARDLCSRLASRLETYESERAKKLEKEKAQHRGVRKEDNISKRAKIATGPSKKTEQKNKKDIESRTEAEETEQRKEIETDEKNRKYWIHEDRFQEQNIKKIQKGNALLEHEIEDEEEQKD